MKKSHGFRVNSVEDMRTKANRDLGFWRVRESKRLW